MATPFQIREYQRALNAWTGHHCKDLLGPVRVDSVLGDSSRKVGLRAAFYLGVWQPTIRKWAENFDDKVLAQLTDWFRHPSHFYATHKTGAKTGEDRRATERAKRQPKTGVVDFDGAHVTAWVAKELERARAAGWQGTIPDKTYGGVRTYAQQQWLYDHDPPPVASPDLPSNHQLVDWDGGAADCSYYDELDSILSRLGSDLGRQGDAASSDPVHFSSAHRFARTGHY